METALLNGFDMVCCLLKQVNKKEKMRLFSLHDSKKITNFASETI